MRNITEHNITEAVVGRFEACTDARLKEVLTSLVRHLHAFVRETHLTEAEWMRGIEFLTLFAFSSENWRRPAEEVSFLMQLFVMALEQEVGKRCGRLANGETWMTPTPNSPSVINATRIAPLRQCSQPKMRI